MTLNDDIEPGLLRLMQAHPLLFRGKPPVVPSYVSPGWYALIDKLCNDLEAVLGPDGCTSLEVLQIKEKFGTLRFYYSLGEREDLHIDIMSPTGRQHIVSGSSSTTSTSDDEAFDAANARVRELVNATCEASESICEACGNSGQLRNLGGWMTTLCDVHLAERQARTSAKRAE